jgi:membrane associated rhomboid family serine protease
VNSCRPLHISSPLLRFAASPGAAGIARTESLLLFWQTGAILFMAYGGSYGGRRIVSGFSGNSAFPPAVKWLLIINGVLFFIYFFAVHTSLREVFHWFGLIPRAVFELFAVWQLFTYMFLHNPYGFEHILLNMFTLWMFGKDLELTWGTRRFLKYYFVCGVGAGICILIGNALYGTLDTRTIGASGAIYGVLLAFGMLFPDVKVLFFFLFPIKAKYFVMIVGAIAFMMTFGSSGGGGVSHVAHLGGMVFGYLYLKSGGRFRIRVGLWSALERQYQQWKLQRAKRKFQVYLKKQRGSDRFVN